MELRLSGMNALSLVPIISLFLAQTLLALVRVPSADEISKLPSTTTRLHGFRGKDQVDATLNAAEPAEVKIPDGTAVHVVLTKTISSEDAKQGEVVELIVAEPVQVRGVEVIASGSKARAIIVKARKTSPNGKPGELVIAMQDVVATDGTRIPIRLLKKALPRLGLEAADIGERILLGISAPFVVFYLPTVDLPTVDLESPRRVQKRKQPGRPAIVDAGENFLVFVNGEMTVKAIPPAATIEKDQN